MKQVPKLAPKGFGLSNFQLKQTHYVLKLKKILAKAIAGLARSPFVLTEHISSSSSSFI